MILPKEIKDIILNYKEELENTEKYNKVINNLERKVQPENNIIDDVENYIERIYWENSKEIKSIEICGRCGNYLVIPVYVNRTTKNKLWCYCQEELVTNT